MSASLEDLPPVDPISPSTLPDNPDLPDSEFFLPPVANLCVTPLSANSDLRGNLYNWCGIKFISPLAFPSTVLHTALLLLLDSYNALLDSSCTHHIIRDRTLFLNYTAQSISVGMANCGSLDVLGSGDVKFCYPFGDHFVTFTLHGCLYAPSAPINLLSVGALVERGMSCLFSPGGITKVFFPDDHAMFPGLSFSAMVTSRLSFLKLVFLSPVASISLALPAALPSSSMSSPSSFPCLRLDSMLWHHHFGHIGMEATQVALMKDFVTGIKLEGPFVCDHCISCIVGKSPQKSYPLRGHCALLVGDLLHMDLCGPFLSRLLVGRSISLTFLTIG